MRFFSVLKPVSYLEGKRRFLQRFLSNVAKHSFAQNPFLSVSGIILQVYLLNLQFQINAYVVFFKECLFINQKQRCLSTFTKTVFRCRITWHHMSSSCLYPRLGGTLALVFNDKNVWFNTWLLFHHQNCTQLDTHRERQAKGEQPFKHTTITPLYCLSSRDNCNAANIDCFYSN